MNHSGNNFAPLESQIEERTELQQVDGTYPKTDTWAARTAQSRGRATGAAFGSPGNSNSSSAAVKNSAAVPHSSQSFQGKGDARFPPGRPPSNDRLPFEWNAIGLEDKLATWRAKAQLKQVHEESEHQSIEQWFASATLTQPRSFGTPSAEDYTRCVQERQETFYDPEHQVYHVALCERSALSDVPRRPRYLSNREANIQGKLTCPPMQRPVTRQVTPATLPRDDDPAPPSAAALVLLTQPSAFRQAASARRNSPVALMVSPTQYHPHWQAQGQTPKDVKYLDFVLDGRLEPPGCRARWVAEMIEQLTRQVATRPGATQGRIEEVQADEAPPPMPRAEIGREGGDYPRGAQSKSPHDPDIEDATSKEAALREPVVAHVEVITSTAHGSRAQVPESNQARSVGPAPNAVPEQENWALGEELPGREMEGGGISPLSFASGLGTVQDCTEPLSQRGAFRSRPPRSTGPTSPPRVGLWVTVTCGQRDRQVMADDAWIPCRAPLRLPRPNTQDMAGLAVELASLKDPMVGLSDRFSGHDLATLTGQVWTETMGRDKTRAPHVGRGHTRRRRRGGSKHQRAGAGPGGCTEGTAAGAVTAADSHGETETNSDAVAVLRPDTTTMTIPDATVVMDSGETAVIHADLAAAKASDGMAGLDPDEKGVKDLTPVVAMGRAVEAATDSDVTAVMDPCVAATMESDGRVATGSRTEEGMWDVGAMDPVVATVRQSDAAAAIDSDGAATDSDMALAGNPPSCQPEAELGRMAKTDPNAVLAARSDGNRAKEGSMEPEEEEGRSIGIPRTGPQPASVEVRLEWGETRLRVTVLREDWEEMQDLGLMIHPGLAVGFAWRRCTPGRRRPLPTIHPVSPEAMEVPLQHWPSSWEGLVEHVDSGGSFRVHRRLRGGMGPSLRTNLDRTVFGANTTKGAKSRSEEPGLVPPVALPDSDQVPVADGTGDAAGAPDNPNGAGH